MVKYILHLTQHSMLGVVPLGLQNWVFKDNIKNLDSLHPFVLLSSAGLLYSLAVSNIKVRHYKMESFFFLPFLL